MLLFSYPSPLLPPYQTQEVQRAKVQPISPANNEGSRDAIEMATLANAAALHQDTEATAKPGPGATGITTKPAVDSFDLSENQIKLSRGLFTFSRITESFSGGKKK